jgi:transcriptional regulator with XRE-family HTH domain
VLREILGLTQKQLGQLIGSSRPTIQAIELGQLRLSDHIAHRISEKTGISVHWLKANDLGRRPVNRWRQRYTRKDFNLARTDALGGTYFVELQPIMIVLNAYAKLRAIVEALNLNDATSGPFPFMLEMVILELEDCITDPDARKKYLARREKSHPENLDDVLKLIRSDIQHITKAKRHLENIDVLLQPYPSDVLIQKPIVLRAAKAAHPEKYPSQ